MKLPISLCFCFLSLINCTDQTKRKDSTYLCQANWRYLELKEPIKGELIFYEQPTIKCGIFSTASVALVKMNNGKTIRVLGLCNSRTETRESQSDFVAKKFILVKPKRVPDFRIDIIPADPLSCSDTETYFGTIQSP